MDNALGYEDHWPEQERVNSYDAWADRFLLRESNWVWFDVFQNRIILVPVKACS